VEVYLSNISNFPTEMWEWEMPVWIERYELRTDSGGVGQFRGGMGIRRDIRVLEEAIMTFVYRGERHRFAAQGLYGGKDGALAEVIFNPDSPGEKRLPGKHSVQLRSGDRVSFRTAGGGGWGDPKKRELSSITDDVVDHKVSTKSALDDYGVSVDNETF
jgi:N-methylhydantoinase B